MGDNPKLLAGPQGSKTDGRNFWSRDNPSSLTQGLNLPMSKIKQSERDRANAERGRKWKETEVRVAKPSSGGYRGEESLLNSLRFLHDPKDRGRRIVNTWKKKREFRSRVCN